MTPDLSAARAVVQSGLTDRAYPASAVEIGSLAGPSWRQAFGRLTYDPNARVCDLTTVFDLASLTKVIATASLAMRLVGRGDLALDAPV